MGSKQCCCIDDAKTNRFETATNMKEERVGLKATEEIVPLPRFEDFEVKEAPQMKTTHVDPTVSAAEENVEETVQLECTSTGMTQSSQIAMLGSQSPDPTGTPEVGSKLQDLTDRVKELRALCYDVRIFDAHNLLLESEKEFASLGAAADVLKSDDLFRRLRCHNQRLITGMKLLEFMPSKSVDEDKRWAKYVTACPDLHPDCKLELICRFLEESERDPAGKATQFVVVFKSVNLPVSLAQQALIYAAIDKYDMTWDSQLKGFDGWPGGREKFNSCVFRKHFKAPIRFASENEIVVLRDFAVCKQGPVSSLGPGLLICGGPPECEPWEGWTIPDPKPGLARSISKSCDYVMAGDHPTTSHLSFVLKMELPIPQYLVPLTLGLKLLSGVAKTTLKSMNDKCWSRFEEVPGMRESMDRMEEFMASLNTLGVDQSPYKRSWSRTSKVSDT